MWIFGWSIAQGAWDSVASESFYCFYCYYLGICISFMWNGSASAPHCILNRMVLVVKAMASAWRCSRISDVLMTNYALKLFYVSCFRKWIDVVFRNSKFSHFCTMAIGNIGFVNKIPIRKCLVNIVRERRSNCDNWMNKKTTTTPTKDTNLFIFLLFFLCVRSHVWFRWDFLKVIRWQRKWNVVPSRHDFDNIVE